MAKRLTPTKSQILEVGRSLFSVYGFNNTAVDDIMLAGGITKGAFYYYFKSKEALCENVIEQAMAEYKELVASIDKTAEPIEQLRRLVAKIVQLNFSGEWVNCRLILRLSLESLTEYPQIQLKLNSFRQWYTGIYGGLIEDCRSAGQISTAVSKDIQCRMLLSFVMGIVAMEVIDPGRGISQDITEEIIKALA
ncbi:MAG: TetR family transcriptional regulator [Planctomycetes bacterium]|nr:TetR family transcriptional regulator [Planctomycetota bacterium]